MTVEQRIDEPSNQFPVGMRVLAVDDDPTCLMLLDTLLRKCHYHVTTTNQAVKALKLLRENKNKFDLVISDVHMPDMDGFKLLELVGLEMDLPVIMLSANGDTKLVMKGITHGACDYLLKPVRIEELRNIWQHVIRRKKFDSRDHNNSDKPQPENGVGQGLKGVGDSDQNGLLNRKRKDQDEDEGDEHDENGNHSDDPSTQKKPRVVWSVELHRKFVAAVNQLGIDKAVPKRILELMNVEKLTRENVASHLQKYRLYLKRISCVASQQANMAAALGSADLSYLRVGSLNGIGNVHAMMGSSPQLQNAVFRSLPSGMFGRLNSPAGLSMRGFSSSAAPQLCHAQDSSNVITDECHPIIIQGNQSGNVLQGMPMPLEIDQLQRNKGVSHVAEISNITNDSTVFPVSGGFSDIKANVGGSSNSILDVPNNPLMIQGHHREIQRSRAFGDQSSVTVAFSNSEFPSHLVDFGRCNDNWPSAVHLIGVQSNCFRLNDCFKQATLSDLTDSASSFSMPSGSNPLDVNSITSGPNHFLDARTNFQCQDVSINSLARKNMNDAQEQVWDGHTQDASHHSNPMCSSTSSLVPPRGLVGPISQNLDPNNTICHGNTSFNMVGHSNFVDPQQVHLNEVEQSAVERRKVNCSSAYNNVGSLEDLASVMMKRV